MSDLVLPPSAQELPVVCFRCGLQCGMALPGIADKIVQANDPDGLPMRAIWRDHEGFEDCLVGLRIQAKRFADDILAQIARLRELKAQHRAITERHNAIVEEKKAHADRQ